MSFRNGLKLAAAALLTLSAAACSGGSNKDTALKVLCPTGAPALASVALADAGAEMEYVDGQDLLVSELAKTDGQYDVIIAPINAGVKVWNEAQAYELDGVLTWGNLYIVSEDGDWNQEGKTLALFGENAVPGMVFGSLYPETACATEFYPSVAEASQALLAGQADAALLAQPAAAGAIAKGSEAGKSFAPVEDVQTKWQQAHESDQKGYPQAAVFVKKGTDFSKGESQIREYIENATPETIEKDVDALGADRLGMPNARLAASTWDAQNIRFEKADSCREEISSFLAVFGMELPEDIIAG